MSPHAIEQLISPDFVSNLTELNIDEVRRRRGLCQDAEEALSLQRRLIQGRLDIVQADLYRRAGGASAQPTEELIESLPDILVEHGDRHLGPGRLTSLDASGPMLDSDFDELVRKLDRIVDGARLSKLDSEDEKTVREMADELDQLERSVSENRHQLHRHIDKFQAEIVRRYKSGEASVEGLLESESPN